MIKFINYTGKYPNLCRGVFTVEIDGKKYKFGHNLKDYDWKTNTYKNEDKDNPIYEKFWLSGGGICASNGWSNIWAEEGDWELNFDVNDYPKDIVDLMPDLIKCFNENVCNGCCGGCI